MASTLAARNFPLFAALVMVAGCAATVPVTPASDVRPPAAESHGDAADSAIDTLALRTHTRVLAHDSMAGRGTGTHGSAAAARYLAGQLRALGLTPLVDDYLLPVPLVRADVSRATLAIDDRAPARHGEGFVLGRFGREGLRAVTAPVTRLESDSSAVQAGAWLLLDRSPGEAALRWLPAWRDAGVTGLLVELPHDATVAGYRMQLGDVRWLLRDGPPEPIWQGDLPVVMIGPSLAAALTPDSRLAFEPNARLDTVIEHNVAGVLAPPGVDRNADLIILTAHFDHLGTVPGLPAGDSIFNGFSDNAAGSAMLLAIAQAAWTRPVERPLLFLFTAAEEVGLLGSLHFVRAHGDVVARTHALVNLDAGAPPALPTAWRLAAGTRSWAGAVAQRVVESHGWTHRSDAGSPNSDHWPFVALGVPAIFLIPDGAYENTSDAEAVRLRERWDRYHHPDDEWSHEFPFSGLARYTSLALDIVRALAAHRETAP